LKTRNKSPVRSGQSSGLLSGLRKRLGASNYMIQIAL
jgi:hypothetical protein